MEYPFGPALVEVFISSLRINESWTITPRKVYIKRNNNKIGSIETGRKWLEKR